MGKKNKTKPPSKQTSLKSLVDREAQTDELERLSHEITTLDDFASVPTSSTELVSCFE